MTSKNIPIYQIKVTLKGSQPPIWRRILVPANYNLFQLHHVLQKVMGWYNCHLHQFIINHEFYGDPADDEFGDMGTRDETKFKLSKLVTRTGFHMTYEYDFGDSWEHILLVEKILPVEKGVHYPVCLAGKRACPPEDVGGVWGYQSFLEAIRDPQNPEHDEWLEWVGGAFNPEAFDLEPINQALERPIKQYQDSDDDWFEEEAIPTASNAAMSFKKELEDLLTAENDAFASPLALRRDVLSFITYLRDNKVTGTQATGNLPLKAIEGIAALFVNPPVLHQTFGEYTISFRNETEVWPIYFVHILAAASGLVTGGNSKRWRITPIGESFLGLPATIQVWTLLTTYWQRVNWLIAYPFVGMGDYLPEGFRQATLTLLLDPPVGTSVQFQPFADRLIQISQLTWSASDSEFGRQALHSAIEKMVIGPLAQFGVLECVYKPNATLGMEYQDLVSFQLTPYGKASLSLINRENS